MFCLGNVFICAVADLALGRDQAVFVLVALLRFLPVCPRARAGERRPELSYADVPFRPSPIPRTAHPLFGNDLRRLRWALWTVFLGPQEMAGQVNQRMDPRPSWRSGHLCVPLQISNF